MANQTLDNFLYFSNGFGCIQAQDANHQIIIRADRNACINDYTNYYQYGGTLSNGLGHKFWTGGVINDQTLKVQFADNGNYFACNVGIGTTSPGATLDVAGTIRAQPGSAGFCADHTYLGITYRLGTGEVSDNIDFKICGGSAGGFTTGGNFRWSTQVGNTAPTERMRITPSGNVGIGTTSPRYSLDVAGGAMSTFYMSCCNATIDGLGSYDFGVIGTGNIAGALVVNDIVGARYAIHGGNYNLTFRKSVRNTVGACAYCTVMQFVANNDIVCNVNVAISYRLGIATTSPSYALHVNGTFYAAGSSQDYKTSVCQYDTDSCMFMKLKPVTYQYKDEWKHLGKELKSETQIGLIAEEVAEVMPELAILVDEDNNKVVRNVDYEKLSIVLLAEVQKLRQEVDQLKQN
jgi:hypothetical protein